MFGMISKLNFLAAAEDFFSSSIEHFYGMFKVFTESLASNIQSTHSFHNVPTLYTVSYTAITTISLISN